MLNKEQINTREVIVKKYSKDLERLQRYLPYLEKKGEKDEQNFYKGNGGEFKSVPFPVYDSNLLAFVKEAQKTQFINRNYPYVYRRNNIRSAEDERRIIQNAKITDVDILIGIFSRYILEGCRRGVVWTEGLKNRIYVDFIRTLNKLFYEFSDHPEKLLY